MGCAAIGNSSFISGAQLELHQRRRYGQLELHQRRRYWQLELHQRAARGAFPGEAPRAVPSILHEGARDEVPCKNGAMGGTDPGPICGAMGGTDPGPFAVPWVGLTQTPFAVQPTSAAVPAAPANHALSTFAHWLQSVSGYSAANSV